MKYFQMPVSFVTGLLHEGNGYDMAHVAICDTGIIICQMYNFSQDIIHPATAGIYYCHDWAQVKLPGKMIFLSGLYQRQKERRQAGGKTLFFKNRLNSDTVFLASVQHHPGFAVQESELRWIHSHRTSPKYPLHHNKERYEQRRLRLTEGPNGCLHCWNSSLTSWVRPHLGDCQHRLLFHFFLSFLLLRSYVD